jgi:carbonic anhydrase
MKHIPFKKSLPALVLLALGSLHASAGDSPVLTQLAEGNARYVAGQPSHPHQDGARRTEVAAGQKPFAVVVGCSDSRTAPEILFDQGLGDLFVTRLAGNVVDDAALGSIEFAVAKLGARMVVVLGHEKCGAVTAAVDAETKGTVLPAHLGAFVDAIKPAAESVKDLPGDPVDNADCANVKWIVGKLKTSNPVLAPLVQSGELQIVGARYDLDDGKVEFFQ